MDNSGLKQDSLHALPAHSTWSKTTPVAVVAGTALVALCAHISVPLGFTPVPVTMQPFAVLFLGLLLSPGAAFACLGLYLMEGAAGLPMFSPHGLGGMLQLLGPTGGYLWASPFAAALTSFLSRRGQRRFVHSLASAAVGSLLILATGAVWLGLIAHESFSLIFAQSVAPFLLGDACKVLAAAGCATMLGALAKNGRKQSL